MFHHGTIQRWNNMPRYTYLCNSCDNVSNIAHLMSERAELCPLCNSEDIKKIPSQFATKINKHKKIGDEVKQSIEENKKILEDQKKDSRKDFITNES